MDIHSPIPWSCDFDIDEERRVNYVKDAEGKSVITTDSGFYIQTHGDMEFIVKAVNSHERLLVLEAAVKNFLERLGDKSDITDCLLAMRQALDGKDLTTNSQQGA